MTLAKAIAAANLDHLKREVRRRPDGYDMCDDDYDLGWNAAVSKCAEQYTAASIQVSIKNYLNDLQGSRLPNRKSFGDYPEWMIPDLKTAWEMTQEILMRCSLTPVEVDHIKSVHKHIAALPDQPMTKEEIMKLLDDKRLHINPAAIDILVSYGALFVREE